MTEEVRWRLLVALGLAPLVLGVVYLGGWPFWVLLALAGLLATWEWNRLLRRSGIEPNEPVSLLLGAALAAREAWPGALPWVLASGVLAAMVMELARSRERSVPGFSGTLAGPLYVPFLLGFLGLFRRAEGPPEGWAWVMGLLLLVWAADTGAWAGGRLWGRRKLAERISPGKTWEGLWSGAILVAGGAFGLQLSLWRDLEAVHVGVLAAVAAFGGPIGDLAESWLKRSVGLKDSSHLLPGHGGILDRVDSLAPVAAAAGLYAYSMGLL